MKFASNKWSCAYQGVKNVRFFGKFDVLCFLETPALRLPFCLITDKINFIPFGPISEIDCVK